MGILYADMGQNVQRNGTRCPIFLRARIQSAAGGTARDPDGETGRTAAQAQQHEAWAGAGGKSFRDGPDLTRLYHSAQKRQINVNMNIT